MVVFTCNHCGESLQKPRVEKHYSTQCRRAKSLTCVDCFKDFKNEEYTVHTKCITEEERYSAKGSIPGGIVKKGEVKQESWTEMIRSIVQTEQSMKASLKNLFDTISNYTNVPRKKAKFINFLKSSTGGRVNFTDIEAAWDLIEKYKNEQKAANNGENTEETINGKKHSIEENGKKSDDTNKKQSCEEPKEEEMKENGVKKKKKRKQESEVVPEVKNGVKHKSEESDDAPKKKKKKVEEQPGAQTEDKSESTFSFKETILNILNSKGSISCKKLQKKVLAAYLKETGNAEYTEKTIKKYNKKLKKLTNVTIEDDTVSLVANSEQ